MLVLLDGANDLHFDPHESSEHLFPVRPQVPPRRRVGDDHWLAAGHRLALQCDAVGGPRREHRPHSVPSGERGKGNKLTARELRLVDVALGDGPKVPLRAVLSVEVPRRREVQPLAIPVRQSHQEIG